MSLGRTLGISAASLCSALAAAAFPPLDLPGCVEVPDEARAACVRRALDAQPIGMDDLEGLLAAAARSPAPVLSVVREVERALDLGGPGTEEWRAAFLEIGARAAVLDGRYTEAAKLWDRTLGLDPGTDRVVRFPAPGEQGWTAEVGAGAGRIQRAAETWLAAGRTEDARRAAARAFALGSDAGRIWAAAGGGVPPGVDPVIGTLDLPAWFRPSGNPEIPLLDGESVDLAGLDGDAVLLDFWASWCAPCMVELPRLQKLYERESARGLHAFAVNSDEPAALARATADKLGLTMPIGRYGRALDEAFAVQALPTVVLLDRHGRIRARWDGYRQGIEDEIESRVVELLDNPGDPPPEAAGSVLIGAPKMRVAWARTLQRPIAGLAAGDFGDAGVRVVAGNGRALVSYREDGRIAGRVAAEAAAAPLYSGDVTGDGIPDVLGVRPGSRRIGIVNLHAGTATAWEAPDPCLDALPAPGTTGVPAGLILTTTGGVIRTGAEGQVRATSTIPAISASPVSGSGGSSIAVLSTDAEIRWIDGGGKVRSTQGVSSALRRLFPGRQGVFAVTADVTGLVEGKFLPGGVQIATATRSGVVSLLDVEDGEVLFRAVVEGAAYVDAVDLDGNGLDELAVAWGTRVAVLSSVVEGLHGSPDVEKKLQNMQADDITSDKNDTM